MEYEQIIKIDLLILILNCENIIPVYWPKMTFDLDFVTWNLRHMICDTW